MVYLFIGEDTSAKDLKFLELKKKFLPSESVHFDHEFLHAPKLDSPALQKALMGLPVIAEKRLIFIRQCHQLSQHNQDLIAGFIDGHFDHAVLVLDSDEWTEKDSFVKKIIGRCQPVIFKTAKKLNVFEMTQAIEMKKEVEALKMLNDLISFGQHPLQIMGAVVWGWRRLRKHMPAQRFERGLRALKEADLNIKRSRLKPEYALEFLIVKLCSKEV